MLCWNERTVASLVPVDMGREEVEKRFPVLLKQIFLVAKMTVERGPTNIRTVDDVLHRDVVEALLLDQFDQGLTQLSLGPQRASIRFVLVIHLSEVSEPSKS